MAKRNKPATVGAIDAPQTWAPLLTPPQVVERERLVSGGSDLATARRASLYVLTKTPVELHAASAGPDGMDALADMLEMAMVWRDYLTEAAELADAALDRLAATAVAAVKAAQS